MRNERNELQQLVDANLSALQWDEWHSRAVMRKIRSQPSRRRNSLLPRVGIAVSAAAALAAAVLLVLPRMSVPDTVNLTQPVETIPFEEVTPAAVPEATADPWSW